MKLKQYLKVELCDITPENIDGYCNIEDVNYKIYQESERIIVGWKYGSRYGSCGFELECDELIINGEIIKDIKEFCIKLMAEYNFAYDEEEGFIKCD